ncbi:DUF3426 domain-containing protein [Microbulbifer halophilus]|uniref:DUF3426 domain-containing protein n=1 Tax=Microbulbifer halophilus TaxID=453963 RepID=A0ABW5E791_9GAMM|nr:DUF3426 domain-containing protein [Microbulbifer halophilus]MCW8126905.1 zinc-ribbon domain-containing protein [Microbulbifer halophilus]
MSQLVTRCPHCSTSFHVNEQQLRAARGAVRCGSCLQVFRADENIVFTESDPGASQDLEALLEDDDFLIHDDIDLGSGDGEPAPPTMPVEEATTEAGPDTGKIEDEPLIGEAFGEEQWQETSTATRAAASGDDDIDELIVDPDDPWANESPDPPASTHANPWSDEPARDGMSERLQQIGPQAAPREDGDISPRHERNHLISAIEPAPLEVSWQPKRDRRVPGWLWTLLALVLLAGLAAQVGYFRFDSLSKQQPWRQLYAAACPTLGCELPPLLDRQAIRTSNLVVRSHPELAGALVVDAVLLNTAPFAQPFPSLQLSFTDLKSRPVAGRRFTPRDYLRGELAGSERMPSGSPVHIAIEIIDPGSEAVNYELHIVR